VVAAAGGAPPPARRGGLLESAAAPTPSNEPAVIQHIVLLKWKPTTTEEDVAAAFEQARRLPVEIDGVLQVTLGRNRGPADHGYTHALIVQLSDESRLSAYLDHPVRRRYVEDCLAPLEAERIEVDVPVDMAVRRPPSRNWEWGATVGMGLPPED